MEEKITNILLIKNGPVIIEGKVKIKYPDGTEIDAINCFICQCGNSTTKPYCDGSHVKINDKDCGCSQI